MKYKNHLSLNPPTYILHRTDQNPPHSGLIIEFMRQEVIN